MARLLVVIASTRPGRVGLPVGSWIVGRARAHEGFAEVEVADLAELALPMMDEPKHPRRGEYEHDHTKAWSATVSAADAVVLVMPEYNHGYTAPLKNALDYLSREWEGKPVGLVSYGGVAAGTRAVQLLKPVLLVLGLRPVGAAVAIPSVSSHVADGVFSPPEAAERSAGAMLDALASTLV